MKSALLILVMLSAGVVMYHIICVSSRLSRKAWAAHPLRFLGLSASYGLVCGGSVGVALHWEPAALLLLFGVAGWVLFDRRDHAM